MRHAAITSQKRSHGLLLLLIDSLTQSPDHPGLKILGATNELCLSEFEPFTVDFFQSKLYSEDWDIILNCLLKTLAVPCENCTMLQLELYKESNNSGPSTNSTAGNSD